MALVLVHVDRWTPITHEWEIFIRGDALTAAGYRVRVEVQPQPLQVRCGELVPRGFWLRPITRTRPADIELVDVPGAVDAWRPLDTEQFRLSDPPGGYRRVIDPDQIRRSRETS